MTIRSKEAGKDVDDIANESEDSENLRCLLVCESSNNKYLPIVTIDAIYKI